MSEETDQAGMGSRKFGGSEDLKRLADGRGNMTLPRRALRWLGQRLLSDSFEGSLCGAAAAFLFIERYTLAIVFLAAWVIAIFAQALANSYKAQTGSQDTAGRSE